MHITANVAPRPLDRLWLRLKPKALSLARRLSPKPAGNVARPRGIPEKRKHASSEDMQRLHRHFDKG